MIRCVGDNNRLDIWRPGPEQSSMPARNSIQSSSYQDGCQGGRCTVLLRLLHCIQNAGLWLCYCFILWSIRSLCLLLSMRWMEWICLCVRVFRLLFCQCFDAVCRVIGPAKTIPLPKIMRNVLSTHSLSVQSLTELPLLKLLETSLVTFRKFYWNASSRKEDRDA